jgi:hypothetical protein
LSGGTCSSTRWCACATNEIARTVGRSVCAFSPRQTPLQAKRWARVLETLNCTTTARSINRKKGFPLTSEWGSADCICGVASANGTTSSDSSKVSGAAPDASSVGCATAIAGAGTSSVIAGGGCSGAGSATSSGSVAAGARRGSAQASTSVERALLPVSASCCGTPSHAVYNSFCKGCHC